MQRGPELSVAGGSEVKTLRHHSHNGVRNSAQRDCFTRHVLTPSKPLLPGAIAQYHCLWGFRQIFTGIKVTSENRRNSQRAEKTIAYHRAVDRFSSRGSAQQVSGLVVNIQRT